MTPKICFFGIGIGLALTISSQATQVQVGSPASSYGPYQTGQGGEFTLHVLNNGLDLSSYSGLTTSQTKNLIAPPSFQTFCIEDNEYIYPYSAIYDVTVTTSAVNGGVSGGNPDPVSKGTGWLYSQFARGTLANYEYRTDPTHQAARHASANSLQQTIWWLEGELGINAPMPLNDFSGALMNFFHTEAAAKADGAEQYGVYALNLKNKDGVAGFGQDQLYYHVPDGGVTTLALLAPAFGFLALSGRRRNP